MTLEQIKNDYAVSIGFDNWMHLTDFHNITDNHTILNCHIDNVMILAQKECLRRASENIDDIPYLHERITNENNIIK